MKNDLVVIGIDPGPHTGIAVLRYRLNRLEPPAIAMETDPNSMLSWLDQFADDAITWSNMGGAEEVRLLLAVERFVVGRRTQRSGRAGGITLSQVGAIEAYVAVSRWPGFRLVKRPAHQVKGWATDNRLAHAGLTEVTKGGDGHKRDAARHALYGAVNLPHGPRDPLSRYAESYPVGQVRR